MTFGAVIVAAGASSRFSGDTPKQFMPLGGNPVLWYSAELLARSGRVRERVVCVPHRYVEAANEILSGLNTEVIEGGETRQESVRRGLDALPRNVDRVLIHDGVRPLVTASLLDRLLNASIEHDAVAPALPIIETIKNVDGSSITGTVDRTGLWTVQTPQVFSRQLITDAHTKAEQDGFTSTDDCQLIERLGVEVFVVEGDRVNVKITTRDDLVLAERLIDSHSTGK